MSEMSGRPFVLLPDESAFIYIPALHSYVSPSMTKIPPRFPNSAEPSLTLPIFALRVEFSHDFFLFLERKKRFFYWCEILCSSHCVRIVKIPCWSSWASRTHESTWLYWKKSRILNKRYKLLQFIIFKFSNW